MGQTDRPDDRRAAGSRLPPTANLLSKGITKRLNPESQNARKSRPAPGFLAKSNTCSRQITAINQRLPNTSRTTNVRSIDLVLVTTAGMLLASFACALAIPFAQAVAHLSLWIR